MQTKLRAKVCSNTAFSAKQQSRLIVRECARGNRVVGLVTSKTTRGRVRNDYVMYSSTAGAMCTIQSLYVR
jgi:hypothetical protein